MWLLWIPFFTTGRHWKPPTWTCENCKKSEELAVDFSGLKLHDKEPPTGARPKNPKITGKQKGKVMLKLITPSHCF